MDIVSLQIRSAFEGAETLLKGSDQMRALAAQAAEAEAEVKRLDQAGARLAGLERLQTESADTAKALDAARERVAALQSALSGASGKDATALGRELRAATQEVAALERTQGKLASRLDKTSKALEAAGFDAKDLAGSQQQLATRTETARAALDRQSKALNEAALAQAKLTAAQDRYARTLASMGNITWIAGAATDLAGSLDRAGFGLSSVTSKAIQFESAVAEMAKVVTATPDQLAALTNELRGMTRELPLAASELAQIAAAGGQLGIVAADLPKFTDLAAKMAVAFDMSAAQAGESVAKMGNVFGLTLDQTRGLGDAVNVLGNNTAAKAAQIVDALTRIGGSARNFGLAAEEAAALSAAMIALGKEPEVAATAINALLSKLQTANVQTPEFRAALQGIGIDAQQMAEAIRTDPVAALNAFLQKLKQLDAQSRSEALVRLFGMEYQASIGSLVNALDQYGAALQLVSDRSRVAGSMQREFQQIADTTANKLRLLRNATDDIAIGLGTTFLPPLQKAATALADFSAEFPTLSGAMASTVLALGTLGIAVGTVGRGVAALGGTLAAARLGLASFGAQATATAASTTALNAGLATTATRLPLLTAGLQGAAAAAVVLGSYKLGETLGEWAFGADQATVATQQLAETQARLTGTLASISQQTGLTFASMQEFNSAVAAGRIEMGEWSGQWRAVSPEVQRLRAELDLLRSGVDQVTQAAGSLPAYLREALASVASQIPGFQAPVTMIRESLALLQVDAGEAATGVRTAFNQMAEAFTTVALRSGESTEAVRLASEALAKNAKTAQEVRLATERLTEAHNAGRLSTEAYAAALAQIQTAAGGVTAALSRAETGTWQFAGSLDQLLQRSQDARTFWEQWAISNSIETLYRDGKLSAGEYLVAQDEVLERMQTLREEGRGTGQVIADELRSATAAAKDLNNELDQTKDKIKAVRSVSVDLSGQVARYGSDVDRYMREQFGSAVDSRVRGQYRALYEEALAASRQRSGGSGANLADLAATGVPV